MDSPKRPISKATYDEVMHDLCEWGIKSRLEVPGQPRLTKLFSTDLEYWRNRKGLNPDGSKK